MKDDNVVPLFGPDKELIALAKQYPSKPPITPTTDPELLCVTRSSQLLLESGLLWRINKEILHPHGLALCVAVLDEEDGIGPPIIHLLRHNEPIHFDPEVDERSQIKYDKFCKDNPLP